MEHKQTENVVITNIDEDQGIVEAIWAVMGNIDKGNDIIHPGAFKKTFNERGNQIKLLDNHRKTSVMDALGTVLELKELPRAELPQELKDTSPDVTGGAWGQFQFLMDTPEGEGAFKRIKSGAIKGWSFGYDALNPDRTNVDKDGQKISVRNLRQIKLYEISPVLFAMNEATTTTDAKSEDKAKWSTAFINNLPDSSFLYIESGGEKDSDGKTTPRTLRHLPYKDAGSKVDLPHLRNALSRLGQPGTGTTGGETWLTETLRTRLQTKAKAILKKEQGKDDKLVFENKAIHLDHLVDSVRNAFYNQYPDVFDEDRRFRVIYYVRQIWDEFLIVQQRGSSGNRLWKIDYQVDDQNVVSIAVPQDWVEVTLAIVPINTQPTNDTTNEIMSEPSKSEKTLTSKSEAEPPEEKDTQLLQLINIELEEMEV